METRVPHPALVRGAKPRELRADRGLRVFLLELWRLRQARARGPHLERGKTRTGASRGRGSSLPLSPSMPSMLCLAFFSPSSSFLSPSSSSSFFPNLILSTRLIELTKPQKFKGKRASISCRSQGAWLPGHLGGSQPLTPYKPLTPSSAKTFNHLHLRKLAHTWALMWGKTAAEALHLTYPCARVCPITHPRCTHTPTAPGSPRSEHPWSAHTQVCRPGSKCLNARVHLKGSMTWGIGIGDPPRAGGSNKIEKMA